MADERGSFGIIGKAWESSKIYNGSNLVRHFDGIVEADTLKTLGEYTREHGLETRGIDFDEKMDDRLAKYNIVKLTPTKHLDEVESPLQMYLITDDKGHDIGTYEITENGPVFHLAPKIKEHNDKIMGKFQGEGREILEREYEVENLEQLVDKLSKGEDIALASEEQARDDISEEYEKRGIDSDEEQQDPEEKKALDKIPQDSRAEAVEIARQNGVKIKEILVIDDPEELSKRIDNRENQISKDKGPVTLIRTKHSGADSLGDDVYVMQDGQEAKQQEQNDAIFENVMDNHKDEGHVDSLDEDDRSEITLEEAQKSIDDDAQRAKAYQEFLEDEKVQDLIKAAKEAIEAEEEAIAQIEYNINNYEAAEGQDQDELTQRLEEDKAEHEKNIDVIKDNLDRDLDDLMRERTKNNKTNSDTTNSDATISNSTSKGKPNMDDEDEDNSDMTIYNTHDKNLHTGM